MFAHRLQHGPGCSSSQWSTPTAPGKLLIQRAGVAELFKNLLGSEELEETERRAPIFRLRVAYWPCFAYSAPEIGIFLFQELDSRNLPSTSKISLTFLLGREQVFDRGDHRSPVDFVAMYT
jgi:hypothetical protein